MSADSSTRTLAGGPALTRLRLALERPSVATSLLLVGSVLLAMLAYFTLAQQIATPWIMVDEIIYSELGKGIAEDGSLRGGSGNFLSFLYPLLIAPAWLASSMETTYALVKAINTILMTLAVVPLYLWAKRLMSPSYAVVTTVLALLMPSFLYVGMIMTENAFLPAFILAAFAMALALERPTFVRQAFALSAIALAMSVRVQGIVLVPVLLTAIAADGLLDWRGGAAKGFVASLVSRIRDFRYSLILVGLVGAGYWIVKTAQGEPLTTGLGAYQIVGETDYTLTETARWSLYHAAELSLSVGLIPVSAFLVLLATAAWRGASSRAERAFLAVTVSATVWLVATVATFASRFALRIEERNLFYLAPLFLLALGLWLSRGAPRPLVAALLAAVAPVVLVFFLPVSRFLNAGLLSDTFGLIPLLRLAGEVEGGVETVESITVLGALVVALIFLVLPGSLLRAIVPAAITLLFLVSSYTVADSIQGYSRSLQGIAYEGDGEWIDEQIGADDNAVYLSGGGADPAEESSRLWQAEFWNRSLGTVYRVGASGPAGVGATVDGATGLIRRQDTGTPIKSSYAVTAAPGYELDGELITQNARLALYRTPGTVGLATIVGGVYGDGWMGASASYTRYATPGDRPGLVRVVVSRKAWVGPDVPGRVHIRVGRSRSGTLEGVTGERRWVVHSSSERSFTLPTPRPPFRVEVFVEPTFSPSSFGQPDSRALGAQVSFAFLQRRP